MLIIFDLDGTLVKTSWKRLFEAYKKVIAADGQNWKNYFPNFSGFKKIWNPDWKKNNKNFYLKNIDEGHRIFYEAYDGSGNNLFLWTLEVIPELSKKHRLAILTNRHSERAGIILEPILKYFDCIVGGDGVRRLKPDPEGIYRVLSILKIPDKNVLMIGDMPDDIMAAKEAGIKAGAVKWGLGNWKKLIECLPDYAFEEYKNLLKI